MSSMSTPSHHTEPDELDLLLPANCPDPYFDTWDRHNSIAFSTATKGLRNAPGENNCFVNSAVQVFWHLDVFRRSYRRLSGHTCMGNSCIFCALKVIFTQFQFSDQASLHPDALRKALAETFANQQRFQLGHMDDAAECFENILRRIHFHIANNCNEDSCTAPHCLPHQKFSLNIVEKVVCPCGASSSPLKFNEMVHYVSAKALVSQARIMQETGDVLHPDRFGLLLRSANAMGDIRDCPGNCGKTVQIRRTLLNSPDVVSIGLVWDSDHPSVETTTEVARSIGTTILMQDVFHSVMQDLRSLPRLQLVGLVCYYGKHYSTFVFHSKLQVWIYFDDATVREIGPRWENVVDKCSKGRYQPLLLLYANPAASPVSVETAPRKRTMAPGFGIPGGPEEESSLDRTHESISSQSSYQQRSRTPNPEPSHLHMMQEGNSGHHPRARSVTPSAMGATSDHSRDGSDHRRQQSFIMAMGVKGPDGGSKSKAPVRMVGGQAGISFDGSVTHQSGQQNYSDYTLSTSDQYRRPSMGGFEPAPLPLTPNMKAYSSDAQRRESFNKKAGKETSMRADVVRYPVGPARTSQGALSPPVYKQGQSYNEQGNNAPPPSLPPKPSNSAAMFYQGGHHSSSRQRTLSQGFMDEAYASDSSTYEGGVLGHTIVKPGVSGGQHRQSQGSDIVSSHTPVQSGLATLPRKKKEIHSQQQLQQHPQQMRQHHLHLRPGSGLGAGTQESSTSFNRQSSSGNLSSLVADNHPRSSSTASMSSVNNNNLQGLPPQIPPKQQNIAPEVDGSHKKSSAAVAASKKLKKEQRKAEKRQQKALSSSSSSYSKPDSSPSPSPLPSDVAASQVPTSSSQGGLQRRPEEFREEKLTYIDRRMVESILKHQGLQRQPSTNSSGSSSSNLSGVSNTTVESDSIMGRLLAAKLGEVTAAGGQPGDASFDNVSIGSHKDSGYGGSDRNSSSSTGSGSVDPYTQYFISKSMVVPRNLNPQFLHHPPAQPGPQQPHQLVSDFTAPDAQVYTANLAHGEAPVKDLSGLSREEMSRHLYETLTQRKIMHPIKESSQEDILKLMSRDKTPTASPQRGPSPSNLPLPLPPAPMSKDSEQRELGKDGRPPPIPPKNFAAFQVSKSSHHQEDSIDSLDTTEVQNDYFVSMCEKADDLMDRCILAETQEDLAAALRFCDGALGCLKEAMNQTDIANKALVYAQKKHNSCLLKSRSLFKRSTAQSKMDGTAQQGGKRSSITSTDSDNSDRSAAARRGTSRRAPARGSELRSSIPSQQQQQQQQSHGVTSTSHGSQLSRQSPGPQQYPSSTPSTSQQQTSYPGMVAGQQGGAPTQPSRPWHGPIVTPSSSAGSSAVNPQHARSGSNTSVRSSTSVPSSLSQGPSSTAHHSHITKSNSSDAAGISSQGLPPSATSSSQGYNLSAGSSSHKMPLDAYGTLPRNRKPRRTSDPTGNSEVYQMYLHKQKTSNSGLQHHQRQGQMSESNSSEGSRESESDSGADNPQKKSNKAEIRELLQSSSVQRHVHQFSGSGSDAPHGQHSESAGSRLSHSSQGSTISASSQHEVSGQYQHQQGTYSMNQHGGQQPSMAKSGSNSSAFYNPQANNQFNHPQQNPMQNIHHQQVPFHQMAPRPGSAQVSSNTANNQHHPPPSGAVSGYNEPLPGHRPSILTPARPHSSSGQPMLYGNTTSNFTNNFNNISNNNRQQQHQQGQTSNIQGIAQTLNNLNISNNTVVPHNNNISSRRPSSGGPPPAPPTRTSSNPDFPQNIRTSAVTPPPYPSSFNVARIKPNSHLGSSPGKGNPLPLRGVAYPPPQVPQLKHATSTQGLNNMPEAPAMAPRPLERCSSQPDVQHLGNSYYQDLSTPSNTPSHAHSDFSRATLEPNLHGQNLNLPPTSNPDCDLQEGNTPSVRALASQFDSASTDRPIIKPKPNIQLPATSPSGPIASRTRSKSESGSKKPKSVLKNKKNKGKAPRKSVTFAADISNSAAGYESAAELTSFSSKFRGDGAERAYYSDDEEHVTDFTSSHSPSSRGFTTALPSNAAPPTQSSDNELDDAEGSSNSSNDGPAPRDEVACQLCRKREMAPGSAYCSKCSFYMSKLVTS